MKALTKKKLVSLAEYREKVFVGDHPPGQSTIRRWVSTGVLKGEKIGGVWFVNVSDDDGRSANDNVNRLVGKVIHG